MPQTVNQSFASGISRRPICRARSLSTALDGVSFDVKKGELLSIVGPSGSGKSTLLSMIGLLDRPTDGSVFIDDVEITKSKESDAPRIRREKIGFVFQHFNLLSNSYRNGERGYCDAVYRNFKEQAQRTGF